MTKQRMSFIFLAIILSISSLYFGYQGIIQYRINNLLKTEQAKSNIKLGIILPYLKNADSLSRQYGCKYLCSLAIRAPIDSAIPRLREIAENDMFMHINYYYYGGGKPYGGKSFNAKSSPTVEVKYTHPNDTTFPIREDAKSAIELNYNRHFMDSLIRTYPGSFSTRVVNIYIRSSTEQDRFTIRELQPHATYEFNKIPQPHKIKALEKYKPKSFSELCEVINMLSEDDHIKINRFVNNNISKINISFSTHYRCPELFAIRNNKLLETARKNVSNNQIGSKNYWDEDEWRNSIEYLLAKHDRFLIDFSFNLLNDTTTFKPADLGMAQGQMQSMERRHVEYPLEYLFRTKAFNRLATIYGLPNAYGIISTDLNVIIFKKLWYAGLKDEIH